MTLAVVAATLVMCEPGSARREWAFVTNGRAMGAGLVAALLLCVAGWRPAG
ncbi:hypothetical protein ACU6WZ_13980 [Streptomyces hypolithicus]